jgi:uncharacterized RmlC-like cupin family protein
VTVRIIHRGDLSPQTAQTPGMERLAAIAGDTVGSKQLWAGVVTMAPGLKSAPHHHGDCESVIYVLSGRIHFLFGERLEQSAEAGPGDFIFVPPNVIHQEMNRSEAEAIDSIVIRSSQENIVVNVDMPEPASSEA